MVTSSDRRQWHFLYKCCYGIHSAVCISPFLNMLRPYTRSHLMPILVASPRSSYRASSSNCKKRARWMSDSTLMIRCIPQGTHMTARRASSRRSEASSTRIFRRRPTTTPSCEVKLARARTRRSRARPRSPWPLHRPLPRRLRFRRLQSAYITACHG